MVRRPTVLAAVTVVTVGIAAVVAVWLGRDGTSATFTRPLATGARTPAGAVATSVFGGLILRHPASWREILSDEASHESGPGQELGFLTDQVVVTPQCVTSGAELTCESPVPHLRPGGIVVTISAAELTPAIAGSTTIGGRPAVVTRSASANCADGAAGPAYEVDAQIQTSVPTRGNSAVTQTIVDACAAYPVSAGTRQSIARMLATARF